MKQVILINDSLNLPRGKLAAQVARVTTTYLFGTTESWNNTDVNLFRAFSNCY